MTAWVAVLALLAYSYGLGAAASLVFRLYRTPIRYAPGVATIIYYGMSLYHPNSAYTAAINGTPYALPDAVRLLASAIAIGLSLLLLARRAEGKK